MCTRLINGHRLVTLIKRPRMAMKFFHLTRTYRLRASSRELSRSKYSIGVIETISHSRVSVHGSMNEMGEIIKSFVGTYCTGNWTKWYSKITYYSLREYPEKGLSFGMCYFNEVIRCCVSQSGNYFKVTNKYFKFSRFQFETLRWFGVASYWMLILVLVFELWSVGTCKRER